MRSTPSWGRNGSGKVHLGKVLAGHPAWAEVTGGEVLFQAGTCSPWSADERARAGIFLGFQHPIEVLRGEQRLHPRLAYNKKAEAGGRDELTPELDDFHPGSGGQMDPAFLTAA